MTQDTLELQKRLALAIQALQKISDFYDQVIIPSGTKEPKELAREALEKLKLYSK